MKKIEKDYLIEWTKENFGYIVAGFCILTLAFMLLYLKRQYIITIIGCVSILALALEKRIRVFDKVVSSLVIFSLAAGFMVFD